MPDEALSKMIRRPLFTPGPRYRLPHFPFLELDPQRHRALTQTEIHAPQANGVFALLAAALDAGHALLRDDMVPVALAGELSGVNLPLCL